MFISEERLCEAYRTMVDAYRFFDRYEGTESVPVRMYYLMDWYQEYFKDIPKEERREIEDVMKAAFRTRSSDMQKYEKFSYLHNICDFVTQFILC